MAHASVRLLALFVLLAVVGCSKEDRAQRYLEQGQELLAQGNLVKAQLEFRNALQIEPQLAPAWYGLGRVQEGQQAWRAAFNAYSRAVELNPADEDARVKRGALLFAGGRPDEARAEAEAVLSAQPNDAGALALRGAVALEQGDVDAAAADAQAALQADPARVDALTLLADVRLQQGQSDAAVALLERAIAADPDSSVLKLRLAALLEQRGETGAVRAVLEQLVEADPEAFEPRLRLARYLAARDELDAAERTLRAAVEAAPQARERQRMLLQFIAETQGAEAAVAELRRLIEASPDDYGLRFDLAARLQEAGALGAAEEVFERIIERDAGGPDALRARGRLAGLTLAQGRSDEALRLAEQVLAADDANADARLVRAAVALQEGDADAAIADLRNILGNQPDNVGALRLLASAHAQRDEWALAQDALAKAIDAAPDNPAPYLALAELRVQAGDTAGATQVLQDLLARVPDNGQAQTALARLQLAAQDTEALAETAGQVLQARPEHPLGYYLRGLILQDQGEFEASVAAFETALEKRPGASAPLIALARSLLALDRPQAAEQRLQGLLADEPGNVVAMNLLGAIYLASDRNEDALDQYRAAIVAAPTSPLGYERLARLQAATVDLGAAGATLERGLAATDRNPRLLQVLGVVEQSRGNFEAAATAYREVLERFADAAVAANNLAMLIADRYPDDAAQLGYARELTEDFAASEQPLLLDTAGWVQYRSGNHARAVELLERATSSGEPTPEQAYHLGMAYLAMDRAEEGRRLLEEALASGQDFAGAEEARGALQERADR